MNVGYVFVTRYIYSNYFIFKNSRKFWKNLIVFKKIKEFIQYKKKYLVDLFDLNFELEFLT